MARIKFTADYDHRWPSGAVTAFKNNWEGTVKREVEEAAVAAGKARRVRVVVESSPSGRSTVMVRRGRGRPKGKRTEGVQGGKIDQAAPAATLPGNLPAELAEPQALTPNLHVDETANSD